MKRKHTNAKIIDNIPYCECGRPLGNLNNYFGARVNGEGFTGFTRYCSGRKCRNLSTYYVDTTLTENIRYVFDIEDVTILKEK